MVLPGCEDCTAPSPPPKLAPGELRMGWLKAFTKSDRNVSRYLSVKAKLFSADRSRPTRPGPRTVPTPHVPKAFGCDGAYEFGSNHWKPPPAYSCLPKTWAGAMQSARDPREFVPEVSPPEIVSGKPPCHEKIPLVCQPPIRASAALFMP